MKSTNVQETEIIAQMPEITPVITGIEAQDNTAVYSAISHIDQDPINTPGFLSIEEAEGIKQNHQINDEIEHVLGVVASMYTDFMAIIGSKINTSSTRTWNNILKAMSIKETASNPV